MFRYALALLAFFAGALPCGATNRLVETPHFEITYEGVDDELVRRFAHEIEGGYLAIANFLNRRPTKAIRVKIDNHVPFPQYDKERSEIFIPADRIRKSVALSLINRRRGPGLMLVLTPIVAPSTNRHWADFLETGLRVYLQEKLGASEYQPFPTMGRDLHEETMSLASEYGRLIPIADVEKARTWRTKMTRTRRLAYLEAGSFVRFLIERHGLEKFLRWYDGHDFERTFGREIAAMEKEWVAHLQVRQP